MSADTQDFNAVIDDIIAVDLCEFAVHSPKVDRTVTRKIVKTIAHHLRFKTYDAHRAKRGFYHIAEYAAREWCSLHAEASDLHVFFPPAVLVCCASKLADHYADEIDNRSVR